MNRHDSFAEMCSAMKQAYSEDGFDDAWGHETRFNSEYTSCVALATSFGIMCLDNTDCHAGLNYTVNNRLDEEDEIYFIATNLQEENRKLDDQNLHFYLDWLLNRSNWNDSFTPLQTAESCIKAGFVMSDPELPANVVVGGAVAVRQSSEHPRNIDLFVEFCKRGMDEDLAYLLAFSCMYSSRFVEEGADYREKLTLNYGTSGHTPMSVNRMGEKAVKNFLNHNRDGEIDSYQEYRQYDNIDALWGEDLKPNMWDDRDSDVEGEELGRYLRDLEWDCEVESKAAFRAGVPTQKILSYKEGIDAIAKLNEQLLEKFA